MLLLLNLVGPESRPNSQVFSAAQGRDEAAILYALAAKMVRMSADLKASITTRETAKQLLCEEPGTLYRALSAEASTSYDLSPVFVVHDELGQVKGPRSEMYEALETATGAQEEPLSVVISTNRVYKKWPEIFNNDAILTSAVLDRLLHRAETITIEGKSYRMREAVDEQ